MGGIFPASKFPYQATQNGCAYNQSDIIGYVNDGFEYLTRRFGEMEPLMR